MPVNATAAFKEMGIRATVGNLNGFLSSVSAMNRAIAKSGTTITKEMVDWQNANNKIINSTNKRLTVIMNAAVRIAEAARTEKQILATVELERVRLAQVIAQTNEDIQESDAKSLSAFEENAQKMSQTLSSISNLISGAKAGGSTGAGGIIGALAGLAAGGPGGAMIGQQLGAQVGGILDQLGIKVDLFGNIWVNMWKRAMAAGNTALNALVGIVQKGLGTVKNIFEQVFGSIQKLFFGPLSLSGLGVAAVFYKISEAVRNLVTNVWDAAAAFQQIRISIKTLVARDIARELNLKGANLEMQEVSDRTEELMTWLKQVAVTSPFTMKSIADTMKFATAMGLSTSMTKDLTLATGNFAAAMGLTEDHQYRIMYNLAQIYQQGKLTGREFRDLAISFVPVYDIIGEMASEVGMATEDFKKLALEGGVPVIKFFEKYIEMMNRDYPNAMKNMSRTWVGVQNNIQDFIQVVMGMEFLGPLMDEISGRIADALDRMLSKETHQRAKDFGEGLRRAFVYAAEASDVLLKSVGELLKLFGVTTPTVEGIADAFAKLYLNMKYAILFLAHVVDSISVAISQTILPTINKLRDPAKESGNWGVNIIRNFAMGMAHAAAKLIGSVIAFINGMLSYWLQGKSPPRVAPDLFKWGQNAMRIFWEGFASVGPPTVILPMIPAEPGQTPDLPPATTPEPAPAATGGGVPAVAPTFNVWGMGLQTAIDLMENFSKEDFSILDDFQSSLKSVLDILVSLDKMGEITGLEKFADISIIMTQALDEFNRTGQISTELMSELSGLGEGLGDQLVELVQLQFNLAAALEAVAEAEEVVKAATEVVEEAEARQHAASHITELAQEALADATKATAEAQERLNEAMEASSKARGKVTGLVRDYNALLRAGVSKDTLKAKLQEINAAEVVVAQTAEAETLAKSELEIAQENEEAKQDAVDTARDAEEILADEVELAQEQLDLAQQNVDALNEQAEILEGLVANQEASIANIVELLQAQADAVAAAQAAAAGGGGGAGEEEGWPTDIIPEIPTPEEIGIEPLDWDAIQAEFEGSIATFWAEVGTQWDLGMKEGLTGNAQQAGKDFATNFLSGITGANLGQIIGNILKQNWGIAAGATIGYVTGGNFGALLGGVVGAQIQKYIKFENLPNVIFNLLLIALNAVVGFFTGGPLGVMESLAGSILGQLLASITNWFKDEDNDIGKEIYDKGEEQILSEVNLESILLSIDEAVGKVLDQIITTITDWFTPNDAGKEIYDKGEEQISDEKNISIAKNALATAFVAILANLLTSAIPDWFNTNDIGNSIASEAAGQVGEGTTSNTTLIGIGSTIVASIGDGIKNGIVTLGGILMQLILDAIKWAKEKLGWRSPAPQFVDMGKSISDSIAYGIGQGAGAIGAALATAVSGAAQGVSLTASVGGRANMTYAPAGIVSAPAISKVNNLSFGNVYLNNNMDWAMFKAQVQRAIVEG